MRTVEVYRFPLGSDDLSAIASILRHEDIFHPSFIPIEFDVYDPLTYAQQQLNHKAKTILLPDLNVVTRWLASLKGVTAKSEHRVVAAVMAFSQCAGIKIDPGIAFYEFAANAGNEAANEDLRHFRIADNLHPSLWADIALKRTSTLQLLPERLPDMPASKPVNFEMPLRRWRRNYIIALKIAELELRGGRSVHLMTELLRWMYEEFLIGGPALILAAHYLAPNSKRRRLLKNLRSPDREQAILGVRNAAWDLTLLSEWLRRIQEQEEQNEITLLCSLDKKVNDFARNLADHSPSELPPTMTIATVLENTWGAATGKRLTSLVESYLSSADNPARQLNRPDEIGLVDHLIDTGEAFLRNWKHQSN